MKANPSSSEIEMRDRLAVIELAASHFDGVNQLEHLLVDLLRLLESGQVQRTVAIGEMVRLATYWPPGAVEVLEFCMHRLRWPEVRYALENHLSSGEDFRTRNLARQALQAFEASWPEGDIYRTYRA